MTYKNIKFEDSAVMRSLERVAVEKGLVKPDILKKEASAKPEEAPHTLSEKILKLCEGLREQGFQKYADEVEVKFLMFKKAENSLYDITKEEGKDLIEFAHPDGGKKLDKGWSDLGTVETILEKQRKIQEVVNKKPTGKLASKNIINTIRIVLAQDAAEPTDPLDTVVEDGGAGDTSSEEDSAQKYFLHLLKRTASLVSSIENAYGKKLSDWSHYDPGAQTDNEAALGMSTVGTTKGFLNNILENITSIQEMPISADAVDELKKNLRSFKIVVNKANNISANYKIRYDAQADAILKDADKVTAFLRGEKPGATKTPASQAPASQAPAGSSSITATDFAQKVNADKQQAAEVTSQLESIANRPSVSGNQQRVAFIEAISKAVQNYTADLNQMANNLSQLGNNTLSLNNITQVTQGTKIFDAVNSYNKFKETAQSFHNAVNQRIKAMQSW